MHHRMDRTFEYLFENVFEAPFDFFQQFGTFWEERNWSRIGHQLEDLYTRLYTFLEGLDHISLPTIRSVMKLDYLSNQKFQPRKPWWNNDLSKEEQSKMYKLLLDNPELAGESFTTLQLNERELYKQTFITPISIDVDAFMQGSIEEKEGYLLTTFGKSEFPHLSFVHK